MSNYSFSIYIQKKDLKGSIGICVNSMHPRLRGENKGTNLDTLCHHYASKIKRGE